MLDECRSEAACAELVAALSPSAGKEPSFGAMGRAETGAVVPACRESQSICWDSAGDFATELQTSKITGLSQQLVSPMSTLKHWDFARPS